MSGLLQPTLVRLALEKFVPANGPAEKISGFSGRQRIDGRRAQLEQRLGDEVPAGANDLLAVSSCFAMVRSLRWMS